VFDHEDHHPLFFLYLDLIQTGVQVLEGSEFFIDSFLSLALGEVGPAAGFEDGGGLAGWERGGEFEFLDSAAGGLVDRSGGHFVFGEFHTAGSIHY